MTTPIIPPPPRIPSSVPPMLASIPEVEGRFIAVVGMIAAAAFLCGMCTGACIAKAQPLPVALARTCVAEAGWRAIDTGECAAIYAVAQSRAERRDVSVERALRDYASEHFDATRERRRWIVGLVASGERPEAWPSQLAWPRYRDRWLATIAHASKVIAGEVASPCEGRVDHWGAPYGGDLERARRAGWLRVQCAEGVRNAYWRVH